MKAAFVVTIALGAAAISMVYVKSYAQDRPEANQAPSCPVDHDHLADIVRNSPDNMTLWIQDPQRILPGNAMPTMGIPEKDARDITAFLYGLK